MVTDRQRKIERRSARGSIVANMPEDRTEGNEAEGAVVSQVQSGRMSGRDVTGSSCQDRGPGEVMECMG